MTAAATAPQETDRRGVRVGGWSRACAGRTGGVVDPPWRSPSPRDGDEAQGSPPVFPAEAGSPVAENGAPPPVRHAGESREASIRGRLACRPPSPSLPREGGERLPGGRRRAVGGRGRRGKCPLLPPPLWGRAGEGGGRVEASPPADGPARPPPSVMPASVIVTNGREVVRAPDGSLSPGRPGGTLMDPGTEAGVTGVWGGDRAWTGVWGGDRAGVMERGAR
ncbi:hypothetical protein GGQ63_003652 [Prosthecomicrobium pneumaticum]|uniref:Uncharacterized protein n=1 Tax=Prosthecomicrobium pneumaticum TaxID=81895 RepID=A0A7W9FPM3_9HYPH|nr:hypothetical protein [Prosthecomicrobium pneumaticum]